MITYYHKYISNAAAVLNPLHYLLRKDVPWTCGEHQKDAFTEVKRLLVSSEVLVHYDPGKDLLLQYDASPYGLGVVLAHSLEDGSERPVAYASRSLSVAEGHYSQLQKEALSICMGYGSSINIAMGDLSKYFQITNR